MDSSTPPACPVCGGREAYTYKPAGGRLHWRCTPCDRFLEWIEPPIILKKKKSKNQEPTDEQI